MGANLSPIKKIFESQFYNRLIFKQQQIQGKKNLPSADIIAPFSLISVVTLQSEIGIIEIRTTVEDTANKKTSATRTNYLISSHRS